jgi:SSS family solute:Na+ symporter
LGLHFFRHLHYLLLLLGAQGVFYGKTSSGYAIAGRSIPFFAFLMAATAASFSGWTFIGHPG